MNKNKFFKIVLTAILILLIIASLSFYVADIILNDTPPKKNLFKALSAVFICLGALIHLYTRRTLHRSLKFYESLYAKEISGAFANAPAHRKKLIIALRLYNENKLDKALKHLLALKTVCNEKNDLHAVGLFTALILTDMRLDDDAIFVYKQLIDMNIFSSTIYGNLGSLYSNTGRYDDAIANFRLAIQNDENNQAAYHNLAKLYFDTFDFENAKVYAHKALAINHKFHMSASLLAIVYSIENDTENAEKYSHIAVSGGENPIRLRRAIYHYKMKEQERKDATDSDSENV